VLAALALSLSEGVVDPPLPADVVAPAEAPAAKDGQAKAKLSIKIKDDAGVEAAHYLSEPDGFKLKSATGVELLRAHVRDGKLVVKDDLGKELLRVVKGREGSFELQSAEGQVDWRLTPIDTGWVLTSGAGERKLEAKGKGAELLVLDAAGKRVGLVKTKGDKLKSEFGEVKRSTHAAIPPAVMAILSVDMLTWTERASLACALLGGLP
jgi:hypothetical protein